MSIESLHLKAVRKGCLASTESILGFSSLVVDWLELISNDGFWSVRTNSLRLVTTPSLLSVSFDL